MLRSNPGEHGDSVRASKSIAGSAKPNIGIGYLGFGADNIIEVDVHLIGVTSSAVIKVELNGDTTATNYYTNGGNNNVLSTIILPSTGSAYFRMVLSPSSTNGTTLVTVIGALTAGGNTTDIQESLYYTVSGAITQINVAHTLGTNLFDIGSTLSIKEIGDI